MINAGYVMGPIQEPLADYAVPAAAASSAWGANAA